MSIWWIVDDEVKVSGGIGTSHLNSLDFGMARSTH